LIVNIFEWMMVALVGSIVGVIGAALIGSGLDAIGFLDHNQWLQGVMCGGATSSVVTTLLYKKYLPDWNK